VLQATGPRLAKALDLNIEAIGTTIAVLTVKPHCALAREESTRAGIKFIRTEPAHMRAPIVIHLS